MRPTTFYGLPEGAAPQSFTAAQDQVWQQRAAPADNGCTEREWQWFCDTAEESCRHAVSQFGRIRDPPHRRVKGSCFSTVARSAIHRGGAEAHSFHMRRLLKLQGRVREWQRQERVGAATIHLQARVLRTWVASCGEAPQTPSEAEAQVTEAIAAAQACQARTAVHRWQRQLAARGKEATKWLKGRQRRVTATDGANTPALSTAASLEHIKAFWQRIWDRPVVNRRAAVQKWPEHGRPRPCSFQPALHKIALNKACSAPGVDGWRGDEVKYWPRQAWVVYSELLCRWAARGSYPRAGAEGLCCRALRRGFGGRSPTDRRDVDLVENHFLGDCQLSGSSSLAGGGPLARPVRGGA